MNKLSAGQRVRVAMVGGTVVEGDLILDHDGDLKIAVTSTSYLWVLVDGALRPGIKSVEVLFTPEPKGLGAVIEAGMDNSTRSKWVSWFNHGAPGVRWRSEYGTNASWRYLIDPVILHEGYTPGVES